MSAKKINNPTILSLLTTAMCSEAQGFNEEAFDHVIELNRRYGLQIDPDSEEVARRNILVLPDSFAYLQMLEKAICSSEQVKPESTPENLEIQVHDYHLTHAAGISKRGLNRQSVVWSESFKQTHDELSVATPFYSKRRGDFYHAFCKKTVCDIDYVMFMRFEWENPNVNDGRDTVYLLATLMEEKDLEKLDYNIPELFLDPHLFLDKPERRNFPGEVKPRTLDFSTHSQINQNDMEYTFSSLDQREQFISMLGECIGKKYGVLHILVPDQQNALNVLSNVWQDLTPEQHRSISFTGAIDQKISGKTQEFYNIRFYPKSSTWDQSPWNNNEENYLDLTD